jgi:DNA modification methylase
MEVKLNHIYQGDCVDVMRTFPEGVIDLTVTSPPYDNLRTYKGYEFNFEEIAKELYRVTKQGGVVVWVVNDATIKGSETGTSFRQALYFMECGFNLHDTMIYHKDNPTPVGGSNRYYQAHEYMFVFSRGRLKTFNPILVPRRNKHNDKRTVRHRSVNRNADGTTAKKLVTINEHVKRNNVWTYTIGGGNSSPDKEAFKHPAIFPEKLAQDHILSWSNVGDLVFDPMCGSGTTCKMAKLNGRNYIGIDIAEEYVELARRRVEDDRSRKVRMEMNRRVG